MAWLPGLACSPMPTRFAQVEDAADYAVAAARGGVLRLATPLGLGKPNVLLNHIYRRAQERASLRLVIYTALSLDPPAPGGELARRFLGPFARRQWGENYPVLEFS